MPRTTEAMTLKFADAGVTQANDTEIGASWRELPDGSREVYFENPERHNEFVNFLTGLFHHSPR
jgi:hypothetical protein